MTSPQPYVLCSRAAQDYAFTIHEDPFSADWRQVAVAFDMGRSHMAHNMLEHPSFGQKVWRQEPLPAPGYAPWLGFGSPFTVTCADTSLVHVES